MFGGDGGKLYGGAGKDILIGFGGGENHFYGKNGSVTSGSTVADGDKDWFVTGGGLNFIHDADADDSISVVGLLPVHGGVQLSWMEGNVAAWAPFSAVFSVVPRAIAGGNLIFALTAALIDQVTQHLLSFGRTQSGQLLTVVAGGRAGAIVMEVINLTLRPAPPAVTS